MRRQSEATWDIQLFLRQVFVSCSSVFGNWMLLLWFIGFAHKAIIFYIFTRSTIYNLNILQDINSHSVLEMLLTFCFFTDISFSERTDIAFPVPSQCTDFSTVFIPVVWRLSSLPADKIHCRLCPYPLSWCLKWAYTHKTML